MKEKIILIIDDNDVDRVGLGEFLESEGFKNIHFAKTGKEGIRLSKTVQPELVILDTVLPDLYGFDVCSKLKSKKDFSGKIIITTGNPGAVDVRGSEMAGADGIAVKTPDYDVLLDAIHKVFNVK